MLIADIESPFILFCTTFIYLLAAHYLADYPLQGDFIAREKNKKRAQLNASTYVLYLHCFVHAFLVFVITESWLAFFIMFFSHYLIDLAKNNDVIDFMTDQALHIVVLVMLACLVVLQS